MSDDPTREPANPQDEWLPPLGDAERAELRPRFWIRLLANNWLSDPEIAGLPLTDKAIVILLMVLEVNMVDDGLPLDGKVTAKLLQVGSKSAARLQQLCQEHFVSDGKRYYRPLTRTEIARSLQVRKKNIDSASKPRKKKGGKGANTPATANDGISGRWEREKEEKEEDLSPSRRERSSSSERRERREEEGSDPRSSSSDADELTLTGSSAGSFPPSSSSADAAWFNELIEGWNRLADEYGLDRAEPSPKLSALALRRRKDDPDFWPNLLAEVELREYHGDKGTFPTLTQALGSCFEKFMRGGYRKK